MAPNRSPSAAVWPAIIVGASILAGSWLVRNSLDRTTSELGRIAAGLTEAKGALEKVAQARPAAAPTPSRRGPDPDKRYTIASSGAPAKGPAAARVKIFEFSDFQ